MITLSASGGSVTFTFSGNSTYLNDGQITVPVNSLALIIDESDMISFKKANSNDIFVSANIAEFGMTKAELESWFKENAVGSTGGGGGGVTPEEFEAYSAETDARIAEDEEVTAAALVSLNNRVSEDEEVTAAAFNSLNEAVSGKADSTDVYSKTEVDDALSGKVDTSDFEVYSGTVDTALSGKQDTLVSSTNIKTINNESLLGSGNIDIQGGGKAIEAGRGIAITTGATADTVSFDLPIYSGGNKSIKIGEDNGTLGGYINLSVGTRNSITGTNSIVVGADNVGNNTQYSAIFGYNNTIEISKNYCVVGGRFNNLKNSHETSFGNSSSSMRKDYGFGNSGNTLFTIGNGYDWSKPHNALEIRQNGDFYIVDTNDTSTSNYWEKPMIKLQDALGGGSSYTAGDGIDITNDVISVTGKVDTTTYNTYTAATDTALSNKQTTLTAGTGISIVDNVISATGGGGGGKAIEAGRGIAITTGATADTVSFNLPISAGTGTNSIREGDMTTASGQFSHAEGYYSRAQAEASHAEGYSTARENYCHSEGYATIAYGFRSHAEGAESVASGDTSHAEGKDTRTSNYAEHASGAFNVSSSASTTFGDSGNTLFSVGNGTSNNARHNAFEIRQNGDIYLSSGGTDIKLQDHLGSGGGGGGKAIEAGRGISITTGETADTVSFNLPISAGTGNYSIIEGRQTQASGVSSHAEGRQTQASGDYSHAEGRATQAIGQSSHSEGYNTTASTDYSHAEGCITLASGRSSHAEGEETQANGYSSHAEGYATITKNSSEHASGQYNNSVSASTTFGDSGNTLFSVGNGTSEYARHNAFEIRQNGDIYLNDGTNDVKLQDTITATAANTTALGGLSLVKLTESEYAALSVKDPDTLYVVIPDPTNP